ncbi:hypothetical protein DL766_001910 [Monosporascus sp. MC13-8B]|uniref:F-box domain-containing protein n=1 Tax=Monosporascus cannonballus TaxID=155416 RepID=A0ABY0HI35_9PEZI|nr:hypothetical protein DL763_004705 [Monosporascus cannonballus]RYO93983.1 hypothetical protein DL762_000731 [Monosporascus cannonballus]RYP36670.1 hypothetical protein DL766_001910 [Monosporascus sp. MC13-8B]
MAASQGAEHTVYQGKSPLQRLPYEIIGFIVQNLDLEDVFELSLCSPDFQYLIGDERFCRAVITAKAPYALEAREAKRTGFARAIRRLVKRRSAVSQAYPYLIGIVGFADSYVYHGGVLCYIIEARPKRWLRILDLHNSANIELVVDIPTLVTEAVLGTRKSTRYKFRVLHHAAGITTCLFSFALPNTENWLLVFNAEKQTIFEPLRLDSAARIFVRNNAEYLYFGTHSDDGGDGFRRWVLRGFSIKENLWFPKKMQLSNLVGYDIGSTACFEVIDDHFYGLSNQTAFEIEEIDWTSYYYCFRFRLDDPDIRKTQVMKRRDSWRRHHSEGPIDDRWSLLKLEKDEDSGKVKIVECRKEWLAGKSGSRRTYYTKEVAFPAASNDGDWPVMNTNEEISDDQAASAIENLNRPKSVTLEERSAYNTSSNAFIDLIDNASTEKGETQCLRLRAGSRRLKPLLLGTSNDLPVPKLHGRSRLEVEIDRLYHPNQIRTWPPKLDPPSPDLVLKGIHNILNPPGYQGNITAAGDERSVVYSTGGSSGELKALVYLSFDPSAKLHGLI